MAERETGGGRLYEDRRRASERGWDRRGRENRKREQKKESSVAERSLSPPRLQKRYKKAIL